MIEIKYGYAFDENALIKHIKASGRDYIIQGQKAVPLVNHSKPQSLDVWLRTTFPKKCDTKLADNYVLDALALTWRFEILEKLQCPDSGMLCKGLRLI
jgi:hypothetical protein